MSETLSEHVIVREPFRAVHARSHVLLLRTVDSRTLSGLKINFGCCNFVVKKKEEKKRREKGVGL